MQSGISQNTHTDHDWAKIGYWLVFSTLIYNIFEGIIALVAGGHAHSDALIGFGLDSLIETAAAGVLLWRVTIEAHGAPDDQIKKAETAVHRFIGLTFFLLSAYIAFDAGSTIFQQHKPSSSPVGIGLAIASLIIMPVLATYKFRAADHLGSRALKAEAKETLACSYLSFTLLVGLGLNALNNNLWWADPAAALLMIPWLIREGMEGFEEEEPE